MNKLKLGLGLFIGLLLLSCESEDDTPEVSAPATYAFERNGNSTVAFSGQTTRIRMGNELSAALLDFDNSTEVSLLEMFRNESENGGDANPFSEAALNDATKSIKSKIATSRDLFFTNASESAQIKADFETWIAGQVNEIFPAKDQVASAGSAGQLADGTVARYVNAKGLEYDQAVIKSMIGALVLDQMINNYLSPAVLDAESNREDNDQAVLVEGQSYTNMEHKWDEAYGYLFGNSLYPEDPLTDLGVDQFLNKYLARIEGDADFTGMAQEVFDALKLGRAAIVAGDYNLRDEQAAIVRTKMSELIAIRAVYYLEQGKLGIADQQYGTAFHDLSEGFGFIYSLRFTHNNLTGESYFSRAEVDAMLNELYGANTNGFWDLDAATLENLSATIAAKFNFTVEQAGS